MQWTGWLVAAALFLYVVLQGILKKWITQAADTLGAALYQRMAGSRLLRARSIARYRAGVLARYGEAYIPFLDLKLPMRDVYVPLAEPPPSGALRVVVTGPPGSGKSMLLRHVMITERDRIPVLCELHRHNGTTLSLEEHVIQQFGLNDFPRSERFVARALRDGQLTVLLDGLDEVSTAERGRVARLILDFAAAHPKTRIVVTCRTAVYVRQLSSEFSDRFAVGEFDDRMIRRFLRNWPGLSSGRVEQLMKALRGTPRVLQLARNPLLLTMIAYLYAAGDEHRKLPHSRAEFYQEATDYLLRLLKDAANRFAGPVKKAVLQRLALAFMDAPSESADRMTLPYAAVVANVAETLPGLHESATDAKAVLAEIVERSGLLLAVDGGERYQFAHLTLQEFMAACELCDLPGLLLERFNADPTRWRECVKLWCGNTTLDSTEVIKAAYAYDPALGLECLADARRYDDGPADAIVRECLSKADDQTMVEAFGILAADQRPRGRQVFAVLARRARGGMRSAIDALAATNTVEACKLLIALDGRAAYRALIRMGDLAVETLPMEQAWEVTAAAQIATPAAASRLVPLLWGDDELASTAAWGLACLMRDPECFEAMRTAKPARKEEDCAWVWEPWRSDADGAMPAITGRIVHRLVESPPNYLWGGGLDNRVAIPLWIILWERQDGFIYHVESHMDTVILQLLREPTARRKHWQELRHPVDEAFTLAKSWHLHVAIALIVSLVLASIEATWLWIGLVGLWLLLVGASQDRRRGAGPAIAAGIGAGTATLLGSIALDGLWGQGWMLAVNTLGLVIAWVLISLGRRRERLSRNPLRKLLPLINPSSAS